MSSMSSFKIHRVASFLRCPTLARDPHLLILNGDGPSTTWVRALLHQLGLSWTIICADGGSNRLFDALEDDVARTVWAPKQICGDLDSIREPVLRFYRSLGSVEIYENSDQDRNDFEKSLLGLRGVSAQPRDVVVIGWDGNRMDHQLAALHVAYQQSEREEQDGLRLYLLTATQVSLVLSPGVHQIVIESGWEGPTCGLIPLGERCRQVRTSGLRWNLDGSTLEFGKFVSSSNEVVEPIVEVECSDRLVWTCDLRIGDRVGSVDGWEGKRGWLDPTL